MRSSAQEKLLNLLYRALKPLVHLLLESGIGHREFSEIAKKAFVDVATKNYGIRGRATNISRVAVMTGLTRKEVKRIRDDIGSNGDSRFSVKSIPGAVVLHHWHTDSEFVGHDGRPRVLTFDSQAESSSPSFTGLVKKYAGDIPPGALRTELVRSGAVTLEPDGSLVAIRRDYSVNDKQDLIERAFTVQIPSMIESIAHNIIPARRSSKTSHTWPEYTVIVRNVPADSREDCAERARARLLATSKSMDDELHLLSNGGGAPEKQGEIAVSVCMFYAESTPSAEKTIT